MKRPINKQLLLVSVGVACGLILIGMGLQSATTGREAQNIPAVIDGVMPEIFAKFPIPRKAPPQPGN